MNNNIKQSLIILIPVFLLMGCGTTVPEAELRSAVNYRSFIPIDPLTADSVNVLNDEGQFEMVMWASLDNDTKRKLLPNQTANMTTYRLESTGEAKYLTSIVSGEMGTYRVIMDYAMYRTDSINGEDGTNLGTGRVGVGLRVKAEIQTFEANVDLGSLIAIGFAAKSNQLRGRLEVHALGLNSPEITTLFPTPSTIDETSIQKTLEALAAIKSKLGDQATNITPQIVAVRFNDANILERTDAKSLLNRTE